MLPVKWYTRYLENQILRNSSFRSRSNEKKRIIIEWLLLVEIYAPQQGEKNRTAEKRQIFSRSFVNVFICINFILYASSYVCVYYTWIGEKLSHMTTDSLFSLSRSSRDLTLTEQCEALKNYTFSGAIIYRNSNKIPFCTLHTFSACSIFTRALTHMHTNE